MMKLAEKKGSLPGGVLPHLVVWGVLFTFPVLFMANETPVTTVVYFRSWLPLFFSAFIFYFNYHVLVNAFLFKNRITSYILINLAMIAVCIVALNRIWDMLYGYFPSWQRPASGRYYYLYKSAFSFALTSGFSVAIRATQKWMRSEAEKKDMENAHLKSEITHLHYQVQPHFFFNSLNNIYSLIGTSPDKAKEAVHGLGKLMRHVLYEASGDRIALAKEIEFLHNYIRLMEIRLPAHVKVYSSFPALINNREVAPLLFVTLVENAFKHGVGISGSVIRVEMQMENGHLYFKTENSDFPKSKDDKSGSGIGLHNLEKRLQLLYPGKFELKHEVEDGIYRAQLMIDL